MTHSAFSGPLFIVGMPRSGSKLLRELLNQHPQIGLPPAESHFIPYFIRRFGNPPPFQQAKEWHHFFQDFERTAFYWHTKREGRTLTMDELARSADLSSWPSILQTILTWYAPPGKAAGFVWGDKTPGYVNHLALLKGLFPAARFLHVIRDPRDVALSAHKTWGKSLYRAAESWRVTLLVARRQAALMGGAYHELFYEELLAEPERVLRPVCDFLERDFVPAMTQLARPVEMLGDARGRLDIVADNQGKYRQELTAAQVRRIEEIVYPLLASDTPYQVCSATAFRPLSPLARRWLAWLDGWAAVRFHVGEKGLRPGLRYFAALHKRSSWRSGAALDRQD
ncbi:MAG: sulfotransferase [Chloroflexota bacterium]